MAYETYETIDEAPTDRIGEITLEHLETYNVLSTAVYNNLIRVFTRMTDSDETRNTGFVNRVIDLVDVIRSMNTQTVKNSEHAINDSTKTPDLKTAHEFESQVRWEQFATGEHHELVDEFNES